MECSVVHIQMIRSATRSDFRDAKLLHPGDLPLAADENGTRSNSVTNLSGVPVELPSYTRLLLTSTPLEGGLLPTDSTAWLRTQH